MALFAIIQKINIMKMKKLEDYSKEEQLQYFETLHGRKPRSWVDYFETMHDGESPTIEDFNAAKESGMLDKLSDKKAEKRNENIERERNKFGSFWENVTETALFSSRWVLAPLYLGLIAAVIVIVVRFFISLWGLIHGILTGDGVENIIYGLLGLLDLALIGNLFIIVMFVGYDNFVSRLDPATESGDKPKWLGHEDFTGLKLKIIGSLIAIASIELLRDFLDAAIQKSINNSVEIWRVAILIAFVVSGLLFALMDYFATKRHIYETEEEVYVKEHKLTEREFEQIQDGSRQKGK